MFTGPLYAGVAIFLVGVVCRVVAWALTPEPFRIPTTTGQQPSVPGVRASRVESPASRVGVVGRMLLETLLFRSLFRNTAPGRQDAGRLCPPPVFFERKALWLAALTFHWSLCVIVLRHLRLFVDPVPRFVTALASADAFFEIGLPTWYASDVLVLGSLAFLLVRRLRDPLLRYLSLPADYLALGVLLAVALSGIGMRYQGRVDIVTIRTYTLAFVAFPVGAASWPVMKVGPASGAAVFWFLGHVLSVSLLLAVFPFSKLMHGAGVWLSPTRTQANDSRRRRHVNPWQAPAPHRAYEEWEREFHDKLEVAGLPVEKV
jgi:nitrate reductase gamma subunit